MNDEIKEALSEVLERLQKDKILYDTVPKIKSGDKDVITAQGIAEMFTNYVFDSHPNPFGISRMEAIKIQSYFSRYSGMNEFYINEVYQEFPGVFMGESRDYINNIRHLNKTIPLF